MKNVSQQSLAAKFIREAELDIQHGLECHQDPRAAYERLVQELNDEATVQGSEDGPSQELKKAIFPTHVLEDYQTNFSLCFPGTR